MYRHIFPLLLCLIAVCAAPRDSPNSEITYVKIQPVTDDTAQKSPHRISRIKNSPLTVQSETEVPIFRVKNLADTGLHVQQNKPHILIQDAEVKQQETRPKSDNTPTKIQDTLTEKENDPGKKENHPIKRDSQLNEQFIADSVLTGEDRLSFNNGNQQDNPRWVRSEDATTNYESDTGEPTGVTESVEESVQQTEKYESKPKAPAPRFISKLSYFQKDDEVRSSIATNLVDSHGRTFQSKCRCEKIWNCPKLQITVPRCPNEYFLCC